MNAVIGSFLTNSTLKAGINFFSKAFVCTGSDVFIFSETSKFFIFCVEESTRKVFMPTRSHAVIAR